MQIRQSSIVQIFYYAISSLALWVLLTGCHSKQAASPITETDFCEPGNPKFCWVSPSPEGHTLNAVWGTNDRDVWAIGDSGTVLHYDGTHFAPLAPITNANLRAIWGSSFADVWIVGEKGQIFHYLDTTHSFTQAYQDTNPSNPSLLAVQGSDAENVWAVGEKATVLHYDGQSWNKVPVDAPFSNFDFTAVFSTGSNDVWIGYSALKGGNPSTGILHYDGQAFTSSFVSTNNLFLGPIVSIWTSGNRLRAAGGALLLSYDVNTWVVEDGNLTGFSAPYDSGSDLIWGISSVTQTVSYYSRSSKTLWELQPATNLLGISIRGVWGSSENNVWAVGVGGVMLHIVNHQIDLTSSIRPHIQYNDIFGTSSNNLWAVGSVYSFTSRGAISHYDGTTWTSIALPTSVKSLQRIWGSSDNNIWAVGENAILFFDGTTWKQEDARLSTILKNDLSSLSINTISGLSSNHIFAGSAGENGFPIFLGFDGTAWKELGTTTVSDIWTQDGTRAWIAGGGISRWDTVALSSASFPNGFPAYHYFSIAGAGTGFDAKFWAIGVRDSISGNPADADYLLIQCNPNTSKCDTAPFYNAWPGVALHTESPDRSGRIWARSATDIWVSVAGQLTHFDGTNWSVRLSSAQINGIWTDSTTSNQWLVGSYDALLHL